MSAAAPALKEISQCAKDYSLTDTSAPPSPTNREAWKPLLERAAHCLAADGQFVDDPPPKKEKARAAEKGKGKGAAASASAWNTPTG